MKQMLKHLESGIKECQKLNIINKYSEVLKMVLEAISKLTKDDDFSDTSTTLPETIHTNEGNNSSFSLCVGSCNRQVNEGNATTKSYQWIDDDDGGDDNDLQVDWERREDIESEDVRGAGIDNAEDDDISICSDVVPLMMTDDDALDEISFTREIMGYADGFEAHEMPIARITEEIEKEEREDEDKYIKENEKHIEPQIFSTPPQFPTIQKQTLKPSFKTSKQKQQQQNRPPLPTKRHHQTEHNEKLSLPSTGISRPTSLERASSWLTSKSSSSSHSRGSRKKREHRLRLSSGSFEETFSRVFYRKNRSTDGSADSQQPRCKLCRKRYDEGIVCKCAKLEV